MPEITDEELARLQATIDYMEDAITDVVGWANDPNTKIRYMHECKRIHQLASDLISEVTKRNVVK